MKILILSFYYKPDLCAGSFRTTSFVNALKSLLYHDDYIDVITTMPNRYMSYKIDASESECIDNLFIKRIKTPLHKSGFIDQARSFSVYFVRTLQYVQDKDYDVVFATSSRLFTAFLGALIAKRKRIPLYLDLRDIFTDTISSVIQNPWLRYILVPFFVMIEKFTVYQADKINLVSVGFLEYFRKKYGQDFKYSLYPNGIDEEFLNFNCNHSFIKEKSSKIKITYSGNIGEGQGLEKIVPHIAKCYNNIEFFIIGDGSRKRALQECTAQLQNVKLIDPINRAELIKYYKNSDFLFLQLNNYDAFKKVLPSKIFEYGATYKPIIAGVDGYAKEFIIEHLPDSLIYKPCDFNDFCEKYNKYTGFVNIEKRKEFIQKFSRKKIMMDMTKDVLTVAQNRL